jgi:hypothetical protein
MDVLERLTDGTYCDFWLVDGEMELNAPRLGRPTKRTLRKPSETALVSANPIPAEQPAKRRRSPRKTNGSATD